MGQPLGWGTKGFPSLRDTHTKALSQGDKGTFGDLQLLYLLGGRLQVKGCEGGQGRSRRALEVKQGPGVCSGNKRTLLEVFIRRAGFG